ncbi:four-jointed box protein 1 [Patagioenas fasciata]|uniref:Four-jointed box protein 1 n=2 Tax=Patagioenas fasciata monilis TaxID=372326 RepID=A0A1V4KEB3_PATFA|nr:four-jointed box protein 1 [Patagioenas fasciata monilis]
MKRAKRAAPGSLPVLGLLLLAALPALWTVLLRREAATQRELDLEPRSPVGLPPGRWGWGRSSATRGEPGGGGQKTFRALLALPAADQEEQGGERRFAAPGSQPPADVASPVERGIFWSRELEKQVPPGFAEEEAVAWLSAARAARVASLERGGCGRSSNRLARLSDGSRACVRYGINPEQIQGEALSYHLAGVLGIQERLPPMALALVEARGQQWEPVREELRGSHWVEGAVVSLTRWVDNLTAVVAPAPWGAEAGAGRWLQPLSAGELGVLPPSQLVELVQWSDLILFDYLTANFDRLVSNFFSLQWDPRVMGRATSNLLRAPDGGLVFMDNEAGLVHGYRLLAMWDPYNESLLRSICVFREGTARRVAELHRRRSAAAELRRRYRAREPLWARLGFLSERQAELLQARVDFVHRHIAHCRAQAAML